MTAQPRGTPPALAYNLRHNKVLHEQVITLVVTTLPMPYVPDEERLWVRAMGHGIFDVALRVGFMEDVDIPRALRQASHFGLTVSEDATYFLGRETLLVTSAPGMAKWREQLFVLMARNDCEARPLLIANCQSGDSSGDCGLRHPGIRIGRLGRLGRLGHLAISGRRRARHARQARARRVDA